MQRLVHEWAHSSYMSGGEVKEDKGDGTIVVAFDAGSEVRVDLLGEPGSKSQVAVVVSGRE